MPRLTLQAIKAYLSPHHRVNNKSISRFYPPATQKPHTTCQNGTFTHHYHSREVLSSRFFERTSLEHRSICRVWIGAKVSPRPRQMLQASSTTQGASSLQSCSPVASEASYLTPTISRYAVDTTRPRTSG